VVRRVLRRITPDQVIVCENDLWFHFLQEAKRFGARIVLVNGKLSHRSARRLHWVPWLARRLFGLVDLFCVQNRIYRDRFVGLGVPSEKVVITGNLKFDDEYAELSAKERAEWRKKLGLDGEAPVLVIGSTHDPEETQILSELRKVWDIFPRLRVLLVPRHPERFETVAQLLSERNIPFTRYSAMEVDSKARVTLVDAMGVLRRCYAIADIALVAGSYTPAVGGHNIMEPCWVGVPVLFGPYMHSQPGLADLIEEYHAGLCVPMSSLAEEINTLLRRPEQREVLGLAGRRLVSAMRGAVQRTLDII